MARRLLSARAPIGSALHFAVRRGHQRVALLLLRSGADPAGASRYRGNYTPLEVAVLNRRFPLARMLMQFGARCTPVALEKAPVCLGLLLPNVCGSSSSAMSPLGSQEAWRPVLQRPYLAALVRKLPVQPKPREETVALRSHAQELLQVMGGLRGPQGQQVVADMWDRLQHGHRVVLQATRDRVWLEPDPYAQIFVRDVLPDFMRRVGSGH